MKRLLIGFAVLALVGAAAWRVTAKPKATDLKTHVVRTSSYWGDFRAKPAAERVGPAPKELIEFLDLDGAVNGFDAQAEPSPEDPVLASELKDAIAALPAALRQMLDARLIGVFLAQGTGSSGFTEVAFDAQGRLVGAFVVLDTTALARKANDWLRFKEGSVFVPDPDLRIEATMAATAADDVPRIAREFVLIHELAHVVGYDSEMHSSWSTPATLLDMEDYAYMAESWGVRDGRLARKRDREAPLPGIVVYYRSAPEKPKAIEATRYYDWLLASDFVTLYAATNPYDDFADALATYVHTKLRGRPFELRAVARDGTVVRRVTACWDEPRCARKRKILEGFLGL